MIDPHGGRLVQRYVTGSQAQELRERAQTLPNVTLDRRQLSDAQVIAQGAFSPLEGFMTSNDYQEVVHRMLLADGQPWPLPVTLAVDSATAAQLREGRGAALTDP